MRRSAHEGRRSFRLATSFLVVLATAACGKKGPPLAPLRLVPAAVTDASARVVGQDVQLHFGLPNKNLNGPGRIDLDHIEIYAITMPPGTNPPSNRDLLTKGRIVGTISVKPPPAEGEATEPEKPDTRPGPGDRVSFVERLTEEKIKPEVLPPPVEPKKKGASAPAPGGVTPEGTPTAPGGPVVPAVTDPAAVATPAAAQPTTPTGQAAAPPTPLTPVSVPVQPLPASGLPVVPATPEQSASPAPPPAAPAATTAGAPGAPQPATPPPTRLRRVYAMRGISHGGRPGQPTRIDVPIVPPPPPVTDVRASFAAHAITLNWQPPVAEPGGPAIAFNVYPATPDAAPLNNAPQPAPSYEHTTMTFGKEQCYVVRTVEVVQNVPFESEPSSPPTCTTPRDIFPPEPPKELRGIASEGAIDLTWEANTEGDLAGYLVLRAEGADDTLRPLMKEPIHETTFHDPTVKAGVQYVYAVIALDSTGNRSKESGRFTETAR
ncbi:MAG TPA: hypothetical protein VHI99_07250 [Vicinamibacterales bacterium]|jgi:predicted small lipoprotein YifL|nr:hypothetical protein [Vicinamibacterales bacterium]